MTTTMHIAMTPWITPHSTGLVSLTSSKLIKVFSVEHAEQASKVYWRRKGGGGGGGGGGNMLPI